MEAVQYCKGIASVLWGDSISTVGDSISTELTLYGVIMTVLTFRDVRNKLEKFSCVNTAILEF